VNTDRVKREDWIVGGLALLLVIDLLELPWHEVAGGTVSGISLPSISNRATGPPDGLLGVLAVLATLAIIFDLLFEHVSPDTQIPAIEGSRTLTRFVLAGTAAGLLAVKFILNLTQIGDLGSGFWFGAVVAAALVFGAMKAWQAEPARTAGGGRSAPEAQAGAAGAQGTAPGQRNTGTVNAADAADVANAPEEREQAAGTAEAPETSAQPES
jgi:hypothetical protein